MKRWAVITVLLYCAALLTLSVPGLVFVSLEYSKTEKSWSLGTTLPELLQIFKHWGYWLWLGILVTAQALLLLVPVDLARQRLPARRKLFWPLVTAAFLLGNLAFTGILALLSAFMADEATMVIEVPVEVALQILDQIPGIAGVRTALGLVPGSTLVSIFTVIGVMILFWMSWALIFFHYAQGDVPATLVRRATRWLLRASILELLVAVPSHIIVRQRGDCCAPFITFWGIVSGISVMLLAFGPGVFFLFARRMRQIQPRTTQTAGPPLR